MKTIPQRTLRNDSADVLRRAEAGERFVVTVNGRPVAVLGPYERRQWVPAQSIRELLVTPTDPTVLVDLRATERDLLSGLELPQQPDLRQLPVAHYGVDRDV